MIKLTKLQAQAIISKLRREAHNLRKSLIEESTRNYTPSQNYKELAKLLNKRDETQKIVDNITNDVKQKLNEISITNVYGFTDKDAILNRLREIEITRKYPAIDADAALDDLIIKSIEDDFNVDEFLRYYLDKLRNNE